MDHSIFQLKDYGRVVLRVKEIMDQKGTNRNQMAKVTGLGYNTVNRYYFNTIVTVDLDILAKMCFVLDCEIADILRYEKSK